MPLSVGKRTAQPLPEFLHREVLDVLFFKAVLVPEFRVDVVFQDGLDFPGISQVWDPVVRVGRMLIRACGCHSRHRSRRLQ